MKQVFQIYEKDEISGLIKEAEVFEGTFEEAIAHIRLTGEIIGLLE